MSPKKCSSPPKLSLTTVRVAAGPECTPKKARKAEAMSNNRHVSERKAKADARSGIRRASVWTLFPDEEEEAEQSDSIS